MSVGSSWDAERTRPRRLRYVRENFPKVGQRFAGLLNGTANECPDGEGAFDERQIHVSAGARSRLAHIRLARVSGESAKAGEE